MNLCVADESISKRGICNQDSQCVGDLICAPHLFTCRSACSSSAFFDHDPTCAENEYCQPYLDEGGDWVGVCVPGAGCVNDADCANTGEFCVEVTDGASTCLSGCEILVLAPGSAFDDNCGGTSVEPKYCQPIGRTGAERLVCLDTTVSANGDRSPCKPVDAPCVDDGLACVDGLCKDYCDPTTSSQCEGNEVCCARTTADGVEYGICETTDEGCG